MLRVASWIVFALLVGVLTGCGEPPVLDYAGPQAGWSHYGNDSGGSRYSPLTQITPDNVDRLEMAWIYHTGDDFTDVGIAQRKLPAAEATPILVAGQLVFCTPYNDVIALDPETGEQRWRFDYQPREQGAYVLTCRGVTAWEAPQLATDAACRQRVLMGTIDARLVAIDARNGALCSDFGEDGMVDLRQGLGTIVSSEYKITSPPVVVDGVVITGAQVEDNQRLDAPSGVVRGFDALSGELVWAWDPVPPGWQRDRSPRSGPQDSPYQPGTPNAWSVFATDPERGLVFVPTGNASPDYFSGERDGLDHYSSSVVALNAASGEVVWHFQTVHHDVFDYDVASQPVLFDYPGPDGPIPALAQPTKQGFIFLFNRETGEPLHDIEERPAPQVSEPGMVLSPTQPWPTFIEPLLPERLTVDDMWGFTPWDRAACRRLFEQYDHFGSFSPPTRRGTIMFPANVGSSNWGSVSIDPERRILVANFNRLANVTRLIPRAEVDDWVQQRGAYLYTVSGSAYAYDQFNLLSPLGAPCNRPPWGALTGIDLDTGRKLWEVPLGTTRDVAPFPIWRKLGVPNQGGSVVTASGLIFIAATTDSYLRAFDIESGAELWKHRLPAGGQATPMTYRLGADGRQYVVIVAGGHAYLGSKLGDAVVAFALPES